MISSQHSKKLGELLVEQGVISRIQLEQALALQRTNRKFLGAVLVDEGWIQPHALLRALGDQFKIPMESIGPDGMDWKIADQFPTGLLSEARCFPIRVDEFSVVVAIANPLDAEAIGAMEQAAAGRKVSLVLVLEGQLKALALAYQRYKLSKLTKKINKQRPKS